MYEDAKDRNLIIVDEGGGLAASSVVRWAPAVIVLGVVAGFVSLAWYAYHAGTQSIRDEDLLIIEADKTPMKEKPLDPGGMKFPNQDKTIFETFAAGSPQPAKVERLVPPPEEPLVEEEETEDSHTTTWINDKLQKHEAGKAAAQRPEQMIAKNKQKDEPTDAAPVVEKQVIEPEAESETRSYVAKDASPPVKTLDRVVHAGEPPAKEKPVAQGGKEERVEPVALNTDKTDSKTTFVAAPSAKAPSAGGTGIQLGAYRSEKEARTAWDKMVQKQRVLSDKSPQIVKADLGAKGIYFRLRVNGFGNSDDATAFCRKLTAGGQPCVIAGK